MSKSSFEVRLILDDMVINGIQPDITDSLLFEDTITCNADSGSRRANWNMLGDGFQTGGRYIFKFCGHCSAFTGKPGQGILIIIG